MAAISVLGGPPGPLLVKPDYSGGGGGPQKWPKITCVFAYKKGGFFEVGGTPRGPPGPHFRGGAGSGLILSLTNVF